MMTLTNREGNLTFGLFNMSYSDVLSLLNTPVNGCDMDIMDCLLIPCSDLYQVLKSKNVADYNLVKERNE